MGVEEGNDDGGKGDGDGNGDKEGNGVQPQHSRHWQRKRDGGDNGDGEGDGTKDMAAHTTPGERGMMVAMGPGLCVSFWTTPHAHESSSGRTWGNCSRNGEQRETG